MKSILLIRLKSIGDVVLTLPAVNAIRDNFPSAKITFLTSQENTGLLHGFREVNEIIALDRAALRSGNPFRVLPEFFGLLHRLRAGQFSLVVDFQGYGETALLARWSGAPHRWGSVYSSGRRWAYTRGVTRNDSIQIASWNLSLLEQCGLKIGCIRNEFILPGDALDEARRLFAAKGLDPTKPTLFLQPFTSTPKKNWPLENYVALAEHWRLQGTQILFGGGPEERTALEPVRLAGFQVAAGVPLPVAAGLMKLSTLVVGGVTGLVHLAVALQKRVVMLIGHPAGEPGFPYQHRDWAIIAPEGKDLVEINQDQVIAACAQAFRDQAGQVST